MQYLQKSGSPSMTTRIGELQRPSAVCPHCGRPVDSAYYFERRRLSIRRTYSALVPNARRPLEYDSVQELRMRALM